MVRCATCDLRFFFPPCPGDDAFYEQLQKFDWYYQSDKPEYGFAQRYISEGERVLEVGCGKGAFRSWLPASANYTGLEFNDEAIRRAKAAGLHVLRQSIEDHAAQIDEKYDVICSFQVLEHVPDAQGFIKACVHALKPGGKLILAVPAEDSFLGLASNAPLNMPPHHALRWTDLALRNLVKREGLSLMELWHEPVASFHQEWHATTLAHTYFMRLGLLRFKLIDASLLRRALERLFRNAAIREFFSFRAARRFPASQYGHTVVLVARRSASQPQAQNTAACERIA
jgi:SAM-dependent methyltransferase